MRREAVEESGALPGTRTAVQVGGLNSCLVLRPGLVRRIKCLSATHWPLTMPGREQGRGSGGIIHCLYSEEIHKL